MKSFDSVTIHRNDAWINPARIQTTSSFTFNTNDIKQYKYNRSHV